MKKAIKTLSIIFIISILFSSCSLQEVEMATPFNEKILFGIGYKTLSNYLGECESMEEFPENETVHYYYNEVIEGYNVSSTYIMSETLIEIEYSINADNNKDFNADEVYDFFFNSYNKLYSKSFGYIKHDDSIDINQLNQNIDVSFGKSEKEVYATCICLEKG